MREEAKQTLERVYKLHKWSAYRDPYLAPECGGLCLIGYRDPEPDSRLADSKVLTSEVVGAKGRRITTASGSVYILMKPDPAYVKWCSENGITIDPENPFKVRS